MTRTIKFRGADKATGIYRYGSLFVEEPCMDFEEPCEPCMAICERRGDGWWLVAPDSVSQFVGYDKNGAEIYEGDKVRNPRDNTIFKAQMNHIYTVKLYEKLA